MFKRILNHRKIGSLVGAIICFTIAAVGIYGIIQMAIGS